MVYMRLVEVISSSFTWREIIEILFCCTQYNVGTHPANCEHILKPNYNDMRRPIEYSAYGEYF